MNGKTQSCGCKKAEMLVPLCKKRITHGGYSEDSNVTTKRLFRIWSEMIRRCEKANHKDYQNYGGRGISVCDEWHSFDNFKEWSLNNGYDVGLSIDRVNVNLGYSPSNCRWATAEVQVNNKRNNRLLTHNGETHTATKWSKILGISYYTAIKALSEGRL